MKMSYYKNKSIKVNVFVTSYMAASGSQLIKDFKEKYLVYMPSESQVRFIPFNLLCTGKLSKIHSNSCYNFLLFSRTRPSI